MRPKPKIRKPGPKNRRHEPGGFGTYSICARCEVTGDFGFATLSDTMAAGAYIGLVRHGTAAVASQGAPNPYLKFWLVGALRAGKSLDVALKESLKRDPDAKDRQLIAVDKSGKAVGHTGRYTVPWCGHVLGDGFAIAGNHLEVETVVQSMAAVWIKTKDQDLPIAERLLMTLERGKAAAGDTRGERAAALQVSGPDGYHKFDLRIDDHSDPVMKLRQLYEDYVAEDAKVDAFLPTRASPGGRIPTPMDDALLYIARYWRQLRRKLGLTRKAPPSEPEPSATLSSGHDRATSATDAPPEGEAKTGAKTGKTEAAE
jgi:uncharacterized Ntn-hydrolase superfamily protein